MTEQREKSGILLTNRQRRSDKSPDYTGTITINGSQYELAAWMREGRNGGQYLTLTAREPQQSPPPSYPRTPTRGQVQRAEDERRRTWR